MLLVDANHLTTRCRHSRVSDLTTSDGRQSGVLHGTLIGLFSAIKATGEDTESTIFVWDGGHSEKRKQILPAYKTGRHKEEMTAEEIADWKAYKEQQHALQECLPLLGVRQIKVPGVEADDLLSILAATFSKSSRVYLFSGDKDFHQLADICTIYDAQKGMLDQKAIYNKWKVGSIEKLLLLRALSGDPSDAISNVPRIGEARANQIVANWNRTDLTETQARWVAHAKAHMDTITRNLTLMRLPRAWNESFYGETEAEQFLQALQAPVAVDRAEFARICISWELTQVLQECRF